MIEHKSFWFFRCILFSMYIFRHIVYTDVYSKNLYVSRKVIMTYNLKWKEYLSYIYLWNPTETHTSTYTHHSPSQGRWATSPEIVCLDRVQPRRPKLPSTQISCSFSPSPSKIAKKTLPSSPLSVSSEAALLLPRPAPAPPSSLPLPLSPSPSLPTWWHAGSLLRLCFPLPLSPSLSRDAAAHRLANGVGGTAVHGRQRLLQVAAAAASSRRSACARGLDETTKP